MKWNPPIAGIDLTVADGAANLEVYVVCQVGGQLRDLRICVCANGLVLQGRAQTYHARQQAERAVWEATRRSVLVNEIAVG